jgi:poly-gamma-glutamate synthesis protein (capsule biosynthesis protein)
LLIHGTGDVNLDPDYVTTYRTRGYGYAWSGLGGLFEGDDVAIVNCECPVSRRGTKYPGKQFNFRGDPAALPAMKAAGVDVASMANNHSYDYGPEALLDTRRNILSAGIAAVGAGRDPAEATRPAMLQAKGWGVAVLGLDQVLDPDPEEKADNGHPGTAGGHDFAAMVAAVRAAKAGADLLAVIIHWGVELDTRPRMLQVTQGHALIDAGADIIFGSHSHRLQPMEMYRGRPIFYSLGNFVWPNFSTAGSTTAVAEVRVSPEGRFAARMLPAFIEAPGHPVLQRP